MWSASLDAAIEERRAAGMARARKKGCRGLSRLAHTGGRGEVVMLGVVSIPLFLKHSDHAHRTNVACHLVVGVTARQRLSHSPLGGGAVDAHVEQFGGSHVEFRRLASDLSR